MTTTQDKSHSEADEPHWVEWATGIISAALVLLMIGWVGWEAVNADDRPPEFEVTVTGRAPVQGGYRVTFDITNKAERTASAVVVRGEILDQGKAIEDAEVTFDYVPAQSKASGAIFLSRDPGNGELRVRALGYTAP